LRIAIAISLPNLPATLLQIGSNDIYQVLRTRGSFRTAFVCGIEHMKADVSLENLRHEAVHRSASRSNELENI